MDRASKGLNDFMDRHEGRKEGSSTAAIMKERKRQGYDKKHEVAKKMHRNVDVKKRKEWFAKNPGMEAELRRAFGEK